LYFGLDYSCHIMAQRFWGRRVRLAQLKLIICQFVHKIGVLVGIFVTCPWQEILS